MFKNILELIDNLEGFFSRPLSEFSSSEEFIISLLVACGHKEDGAQVKSIKAGSRAYFSKVVSAGDGYFSR